MKRYFSHLIILPDGSRLEDFVVEVNGANFSYYPFTGEIHSTVYVDQPILLSSRADLAGKTITLDLLSWALHVDGTPENVYAYSLTPCVSCANGRYVMTKL
ncbi:MAG: hypothetical protein IKV15_10085 [Bacteroidaceae bacterium]|nr:hypothetical protein [Bacteroidaceae bacterium]